MKKLLQCPSCEHVAPLPASTCPSCGVVYGQLLSPDETSSGSAQKSGVVSKGQKSTYIFALIFVAVIVASMVERTKNGAAEQHPTVQNAYDGSVYQVRQFLKQQLKDPDSYQSIDWSKVVRQSDGSYLVWHKYRAKNSFGGYVVQANQFIIDGNGNVQVAKASAATTTPQAKAETATRQHQTIQEVVPVETDDEVSFWRCPGNNFTETPTDAACVNMKTHKTWAEHRAADGKAK